MNFSQWVNRIFWSLFCGGVLFCLVRLAGERGAVWAIAAGTGLLAALLVFLLGFQKNKS